jgi:hypothetical protein
LFAFDCSLDARFVLKIDCDRIGVENPGVENWGGKSLRCGQGNAVVRTKKNDV